MPEFKYARPTIGVLAGWQAMIGKIPDRYLGSILAGIQSAASSRACNLLLAWSQGRVTAPERVHPAWPVVAAYSDFVPVGPWNTDGLIVFAPVIHPSRSAYLQELRAQGFPVLFIASGEGEPMVSVDNGGGIRQAVAHLVEHGHRQIAFVAGQPEDKGDSEARFRAYQAAVAAHGLSNDPRLVAWGGHTFSGGSQAAREIIATGVKFTAIVASDDVSAIGVMQALREAGLKIPGDVAVIGFDDQPDAVAQVPPLATVHVPLAEIGRQALQLMWEHLTEGRPLESIQVAAGLAPRRSCGCIPGIVSSAGAGLSLSGPARASLVQKPAEPVDIQAVAAEMVSGISSPGSNGEAPLVGRLCTELVKAFVSALEERNAVLFQNALMDILNTLEQANSDTHRWQEAISILHRKITCLPVDWADQKIRWTAEDMLHMARAAISESVQRQNDRRLFEGVSMDQALSQLTARLSGILDEKQAVEELEAQLPSVAIRHARVALFTAQGEDPVAWSTVLSTGLNKEHLDMCFASRDFPPPALYPPDEVLNLALVPLVFQDEAFGYAAFDAENLGPCIVIAQQLAATIKAARLHQEVTELSLMDPLTNVHNRRYFDLFLKNEVARSHRYGRGLVLIILDIDHFKAYNDTFGHPLGDKVLQFVAMQLKKERRNTDIVARIGGDEFALILPETEVADAVHIAERIQAAMIHSFDPRYPITLSIGLSALSGSAIEAEGLIGQADLALYHAKRAGRNRITVYE